MKTFDVELFRAGNGEIIGVDEVGRGCLAGCVTASAVCIGTNFNDPGIEDSKNLSARKREELAEYINQHAVGYAVAHIDVETIYNINILQAALLAMKTAILKLVEQIGASDKRIIIIDGKFVTDLSYDQLAVPKGDQVSTVIGAASNIAKVHRDALMNDLHRQYPHYGFNENKGYGTVRHRDAIEKFGITPLHRRSFKGVREYV